MPADYEIRPYRATDETALLTVWNETMQADPIDALTWRSRFLLDPNFDANECPVAVDTASGLVVGFMLALSQKSPSSRHISGVNGWVAGFGVARDRRRNGIGRALLEQIESHWATMGIVRIEFGPYVPGYIAPGVDEADYGDGLLFLTAVGATLQSRPLSMKVSLTGYRPSPGVGDFTRMLVKDDIAIRPAAPADIVPLLAFIDVHFPHWRNDAASAMSDCFGGDPRQVTLHVALNGDKIVGYAQSRLERFGPFGVDDAYRGRGIGAVLLSATLCSMRARGMHCAWFLWTSDRAAKLYRDHGFEEVRRFALMAKTIHTCGVTG